LQRVLSQTLECHLRYMYDILKCSETWERSLPGVSKTSERLSDDVTKKNIVANKMSSERCLWLPSDYSPTSGRYCPTSLRAFYPSQAHRRNFIIWRVVGAVS
jgi:hypothetical protein